MAFLCKTAGILSPLSAEVGEDLRTVRRSHPGATGGRPPHPSCASRRVALLLVVAAVSPLAVAAARAGRGHVAPGGRLGEHAVPHGAGRLGRHAAGRHVHGEGVGAPRPVPLLRSQPAVPPDRGRPPLDGVDGRHRQRGDDRRHRRGGVATRPFAAAGRGDDAGGSAGARLRSRAPGRPVEPAPRPAAVPARPAPGVDAALGRPSSVAVAALPAVVAVQCHVSFVPLIGVVAIWLVCWCLWGRRLVADGAAPPVAGPGDPPGGWSGGLRDVVPPCPPWRPWRRAAAVGLAIAAVLSLAPLVDLVLDTHNLARVAHHLGAGDGEQVGPVHGLSLVGRAVRPDGPWMGGAEPSDLRGVLGSGPVGVVVVLGLLAGCLHLARRRGMADVAALATLAAALVVALGPGRGEPRRAGVRLPHAVAQGRGRSRLVHRGVDRLAVGRAATFGGCRTAGSSPRERARRWWRPRPGAGARPPAWGRPARPSRPWCRTCGRRWTRGCAGTAPTGSRRWPTRTGTTPPGSSTT